VFSTVEDESEYLRPLTDPVGKVQSDDMQFCFSPEVAVGRTAPEFDLIGPATIVHQELALLRH